MSEKNKDDREADATFDEIIATEEAADTESKSSAKPAKKGGASTSIAWLALFIALISVAAAGYLLLEKIRNASSAAESSAELAALQRGLNASTQSIEAIKGDVGQLSSDDAGTNASLDDLRRDV